MASICRSGIINAAMKEKKGNRRQREESQRRMREKIKHQREKRAVKNGERREEYQYSDIMALNSERRKMRRKRYGNNM